jgi:hypothetical protein
MKIFLMQMKVDLIEASFQGEVLAALRLRTVNLKIELRLRRILMILQTRLKAESLDQEKSNFQDH